MKFVQKKGLQDSHLIHSEDSGSKLKLAWYIDD